MPYNPRYLSGQGATTVMIAEEAITTDKLTDESVTQAKLADNAVTSEKIAAGAVKSENIATGAVTADDISPNAITADKIADGAVTPAKLSVSIPTRPLVPGAATNEVADGAVTAAKLANNSVETAKVLDGSITEAKLAAGAIGADKIKDGAVTTNKIAGSAITTEKIAAGAVVGTDIHDGAVSETKLGTNAVTTVKIKDGNVTQAKLSFVPLGRPLVPGAATVEIADEAVTVQKLEQYLLDKYYEGRDFFFDNFLGSVLSEQWTEAGDPGGFASSRAVTTHDDNNDAYRIDFDGNRKVIIDETTRFFARIKPTSSLNVYYFIGLYLYYVSLPDPIEGFIGFRLDTSIDNNWRAVCKYGAAETVIDTGIAVSNTTKNFRFEVVADDEVNFYIENVLVATITTNIPWQERSEPRIEVKTLTAAHKTLAIGKLIISTIPTTIVT